MKHASLISGILLALLLCPSVSHAAGLTEKTGYLRYMMAVAVENRKLDGKGILPLSYVPADGEGTEKFPRLSKLTDFVQNSSVLSSLTQVQNSEKWQAAREKMQKWAEFTQTILDTVEQGSNMQEKLTTLKSQWTDLKEGIQERKAEHGHGTSTIRDIFNWRKS